MTQSMTLPLPQIARQIWRAVLLSAGPLYFGFSDGVTQQGVAALYNQDELCAAQQASLQCGWMRAGGSHWSNCGWQYCFAHCTS